MESGGVVDGGHGGGMKAQPEKEGRLCHFGFSEQQMFACSTDIVQPTAEEEISEHPDDNRQEEDPVHNYIPVGA